MFRYWKVRFTIGYAMQDNTGTVYMYIKYDINDIYFLLFQFCFGLFDCYEKKTGDVIKLLKDLSEKYVPIKDDYVYEPGFFGAKY